MKRSASNARRCQPQRRTVLIHGLGALTLALTTTRSRALATVMAPAGQVTIENFAPSGKSLGFVRVDKLIRTEEQWRQSLSPEAYEITRHAGTERAGTGKYAYNHADGLYRCICCDTALFDSKTKFESGTGWPSFWAPISDKNVTQSGDHTFGMIRIAVACTRCDAHLGHVFDDGPKPTGLRFCMNSAALNFVARS